ncbi:hypothetical protein BGY98DRAFT_933443 [Russula aff. rugulosa BPL654]|nr:hypothetical protein BGY98DRAFT_933443 [Russula aff. rugulosa BPL654]
MRTCTTDYESLDGKFVRQEHYHDNTIDYDDVNQLFWYSKGIVRIVLTDKNHASFKTNYKKRSFGHLLVNVNRICVIHILMVLTLPRKDVRRVDGVIQVTEFTGKLRVWRGSPGETGSVGPVDKKWTLLIHSCPLYCVLTKREKVFFSPRLELTAFGGNASDINELDTLKGTIFDEIPSSREAAPFLAIYIPAMVCDRVGKRNHTPTDDNCEVILSSACDIREHAIDRVGATKLTVPHFLWVTRRGRAIHATSQTADPPSWYYQGA